MNAGNVIMIFRSAKLYNEFIASLKGMGGYTLLLQDGRFSHTMTVNNVELKMFLDLLSFTGLQKKLATLELADWIVCKDFYPDELESKFMVSRLNAKGALSYGELYIHGTEEVPDKLRWWQ